MKKKVPAIRKKIRARPAPKKEKPILPAVNWLGIHNLPAVPGANRKKRILGRGSGSGHGKTSTRGSKGQTSRTGRDFYLGFEGGQTPLIRRIAKRGFTSKRKRKIQIVNLADLAGIKESLINPEVLKERKIIGRRVQWVKILGEGELKHPLTVQAHAFSRKAAEQIKNAGGKAEVLPSLSGRA